MPGTVPTLCPVSPYEVFMKKKITAIVLAICIAVTSVLSNINVMPVQAASSYALDIDYQAELMMLIYSVLHSAMIASGAKEGMNTYDSSRSLLDAFQSFADATVTSDVDISYLVGTKMTYDDGTVVTFAGDQMIISYPTGKTESVPVVGLGSVTVDGDEDTSIDEDLDGDGDFDLDDYIAKKQALRDAVLKERFEMYYEDLQNGGSSGDSGGSGDSDNDNKPFSKIKAVTIGTGLVGAAAGFIKALWNDEVEGVDKDLYYGESSYDLNAFNDFYNGYKGFSNLGTRNFYVSHNETNFVYTTYKSWNLTDSSYYYAICYTGKTNNQNWQQLGLYQYEIGTDKSIIRSNFDCSVTNITEYKDGRDTVISTGTESGLELWYVPYYNYNFGFMLFDSTASFLNFIKDGDISGVVNAPDYIYPALADSVPDTLAPISGININPNDMVTVNRALSTAAEAIEPDITADIDTNTQTYTQTIADTLTEVQPETVPETSTGTGGGTSIDTPSDTADESARSSDFKDFINTILILFYILFALLKIFLHCLEFIICIFKIPATNGYLPDEMVQALDYLKSFNVGNLEISVYDFMLGLIYILVLFFFIGVLRKNVDRINIPKQTHAKK